MPGLTLRRQEDLGEPPADSATDELKLADALEEEKMESSESSASIP